MATFTPIGVLAEVRNIGQFRADLASMGKSVRDTGGFADGVKGQFLGLGGSVLSLGQTAAMAAAGGIAALGAGLTAIVATSVGVAARVSEMTRVVHFLGNEAGMTTDEVDDFVQSLVDAGIRMDVAQQVASQMIRRNIDMSKALDLVKVAQGAAIIANEDSSDTLQAIMDAISTNNVLMLRRRGIIVDATMAYEEYMKAEGEGTQATIDNSAAIAEQTQKLDFLQRETAMAEQSLKDANDELYEAGKWYAEGSVQLNKFQKRVDKAALALDKKRATLNEANKELVELKAAHGAVDKTIKVTTDDLTGEQRSAAFLNAVLKDGTKLIPLYDEAMKEPGKRARSLKRDIFNLRLAIGTPFLKAFGEGVDALRAFVKQLTGAIAEGGALRPVIEGIAEVATGVITKILDLASQVATLALAGDFGGILGMLGLGPEATALVGKVLADLRELAQVVLGVVGPALQFVADNAMPALTQAIAFVNEHWDAFRGALIAVGALLGGAAIAAAVVGLGAAIAGLLSPINLIIAAVALLGAAWAENWFGIQEKAQWAWETIQRIGGAIADLFATSVLPQLQEAFANITVALNNMGLEWSDVWEALKTAAKIVIGAIIFGVIGLVTLIASAVNGIASALAYVTGRWQVAGADIVKIIEGIAKMWAGAVEGFKALIHGDFTEALEFWKVGWEGAVQTITGFLELLGHSFETAFGTARSFIQGVIDGIGQLTGALEGLDLPPWLLPGSATPFEEALLAIGRVVLENMLPAFVKFTATLFEKWTVFQEEWTLGNELMVSTWTASMDILLSTLVQFVEAALVELQKLLDKFNQIVAAIRQMATGLIQAKNALQDLISDKNMGSLQRFLDIVQDLAEAFEDLASAIKEAAAEAKKAGGGGGETPAPASGYQRGGSFTVPSTVGPEGVPIRVHRLERVSVFPAGRAAGAGAGGVNVTVNTGDINNGMDLATLEAVITQTVTDAIS